MTTLSRPLGPFKRQPRMMQMRALELSAEREYFALFMEQRTGKSQVVIDTAAHNYRLGRINCLMVVAPKGVHRNWVTDEIPECMPEDVNCQAIYWQTGKMERPAIKQELFALLGHTGLSVLSVNIDAILSAYTKKVLWAFLKRRKVLAVIDESLDISSPGIKRTKTALAIGRNSVMRRILDGTPVDAKPLGLYSQTNFLEVGLLGFKTAAEFRTHYAEYEDRVSRQGQAFKVLTRYKHLDQMSERLNLFSIRVTRADCADLPPKIYEKRYFEMTPVQQRIYTQLRTKFLAELGDRIIDGQSVLTRYLRLQQITSNYTTVASDPHPCPDCEGLHCLRCEGTGIIPGEIKLTVVDPATNPRLNAFLDVVERLPGKGIVWAKFRADFEVLRQAADKEGKKMAFYYGGIGDEARAKAIKDFQNGTIDWFIANPQSAGRGLNLSRADWVVYYSLGWSLRNRRQSEDRPITLTRKDSVLYIDIVAQDTIDERIINALRRGKELSDMVIGDKTEQWI